MVRGIGAHVSTSGGLPKAINNIVDIGGNCLQIFLGSPRVWSKKIPSQQEIDQFLLQAKINNISPVFVHSSYLINLATTDQLLLKKSINSIISDLDFSDRINAIGAIVHIGSHQGRGFDLVKDQLFSSINSILDENLNSNLILENDAGQNGKIGSIEEIAEIDRTIKSDRIKVCLDTAHLFESGIDLRDKDKIVGFKDKLIDYGLINKLVCLHLNDSKTPFGSHRDMHENIGQGEIGLDGLKNFCGLFPDTPIILEVPGENHTGPNKENILITKEICQ